jgi:hypothetical protein
VRQQAREVLGRELKIEIKLDENAGENAGGKDAGDGDERVDMAVKVFRGEVIK